MLQQHFSCIAFKNNDKDSFSSDVLNINEYIFFSNLFKVSPPLILLSQCQGKDSCFFY